MSDETKTCSTCKFWQDGPSGTKECAELGESFHARIETDWPDQTAVFQALETPADFRCDLWEKG